MNINNKNSDIPTLFEIRLPQITEFSVNKSTFIL